MKPSHRPIAVPHEPARRKALPALLLLAALVQTSLAQSARPNIVLIYADDIGYGDISAYGATEVRTPNVDRVASKGLRLTNGHSAAATCTPSRYSLLTGQYAWRKKGTDILPGNANLIIPPGSATLPALLRKAGYTTGVVGKWHLGFGDSPIDWNAELKPGPLDIGFDSAFILPATGDRVPTVLVENRRVVGLDPEDPLEVSYQRNFPGEPTGQDNPELLKVRHSYGHNQSIHNGIGRIGFQKGGKSARWSDEDLADVFTERAVRFIETHKDQPFFLYFATHDIHVPRVPHPRFAGKSGLGPRGDALLQFDWVVGRIDEALGRLGLSDNTLLIISSDNGPVIDDGYMDDAVRKLGAHTPSGPWRGGKYSAFEAGTRVPFVLRWPARIKPAVSGALASQIDLISSLASLTGARLGEKDAPDSFDLLPVFLGDSTEGRPYLVRQGAAFSITRGDWKYIEPVGGKNVSRRNPHTNTETGRDNVPQLYHLKDDPGERKNLAGAHPGRVAELAALLEKVRKNPRSRTLSSP